MHAITASVAGIGAARRPPPGLAMAGWPRWWAGRRGGRLVESARGKETVRRFWQLGELTAARTTRSCWASAPTRKHGRPTQS